MTLRTIDMARELAERMTPPESADDTLARIKKYLENPHLPERTACAIALAAIYKWEQR